MVTRAGRIRVARDGAFRLAYALTKNDHEAAEALGTKIRTFRDWRRNRRLWSKFERRSRPE